MKNFVYLIFTTIFLIGCSEEKGEPLTKAEDERRADAQQVKEQFQSYLSGVWIPAGYVNDLKKTKSPLKSYDKLENISQIIFPELIGNDSLEVSSGLNNHEGFGFHILYEKGINEMSLKTNISSYIYDVDKGFCDIGFQKIASDTILNVLVYNQEKKLVKKIPFRKIGEKEEEDTYALGVDYYVNKLIFEGKYMLLDSLNVGREVEFKANGVLIGFDSYKNYQVINDFGTLVENNLDNINFEKDKRNFDNYLYKFDGDTIRIHKPAFVDEEEILYGYGDVLYRLVKK